MFPADDVVNLVRLEGVILMEEAIFTAITGSAAAPSSSNPAPSVDVSIVASSERSAELAGCGGSAGRTGWGGKFVTDVCHC